MKPCYRNRSRIAWLAVGALDSRAAASLRAHLETCEGCRRYSADIIDVTAKLRAATPASDREVPESFHRRVAQRVRVTESGLVGGHLAGWLRTTPFAWRVAAPFAVVVMLIALILAVQRPHPVPSPPTLPLGQQARVSVAALNLAPTLANYRVIAGQSLEKLSALLNRQGSRPLPPAPIYTPVSLILTNGSSW